MKISNVRVVPAEMQALVKALSQDLQSPGIARLAQAFSESNWMDVVTQRVDVRSYVNSDGGWDSSCVEKYMCDNLAATLFKKCVDFPIEVDRDAATLQKWIEGEVNCYKSNKRLSNFGRGFITRTDADTFASDFIDAMRKIIADWLGPLPDLELRFGKGSTVLDRGDRTALPDKLSSFPAFTPNCRAEGIRMYVGTLWSHIGSTLGVDPCEVLGDRYGQADKTALINRPTSPQPSLNLAIQLPHGAAIRSAMKHRAGWDLRKAQEIHRRVACESSVSRKFATIDLSNASDTICRRLVKLLLPHRWYEALAECRTEYTMFKDRIVHLNKFSAMGCGFTFELESMIFAAATVVWTRLHGGEGRLGRDVFVYGDDIILRDELAPGFVSVLAFLGFEVNSEKSFWGDIPFRESCGGDYLCGHNVRGLYVKEFPRNAGDIVVILNQLNAWLTQYEEVARRRPMRAWLRLLDHTPTWVRDCRGPAYMGDLVIHERQEARWTVKLRAKKERVLTNPDPTNPQIVRKHYRFIGMFHYIKVLRPDVRTVQWKHWHPDVVLACACLGYGDGMEGVTPRQVITSYRTGWAQLSWEAVAAD